MRATATAAMWRPRRAAVRSAKARSGPGAFAADQAASTSACLAAAALLGDAALPRLGDARLAQLRVETEVAGEMPRTLEAADVADRSHQRRRGRHVHARDRHQPADLRRGERLLGDRPIDVREFVLQEVELAQASVDRFPLVERELERREPRPTALAEDVRDGRAPPAECGAAPPRSRSSSWSTASRAAGGARRADATAASARHRAQHGGRDRRRATRPACRHRSRPSSPSPPRSHAPCARARARPHRRAAR